MTETTIALMTRLHAARRWGEAVRFREETRMRLRADGMRRGESVASIAGATSNGHTVRLHHQFPNDMKLLGRDGNRDFCPDPHPVVASPVCG